MQQRLSKAALAPEASLEGCEIALSDIRPTPENDDLYRPVDPNDPEIIALAESILQYGLREPIVVSEDRYILSGHRRYAACQLAGLDHVPIRRESISRSTDRESFLRLLREYNRQRNKTSAERLREEIVSADPESAYQSLIEHRQQQSEVTTAAMSITGTTRRARISKAKQPFLKAVLSVLDARRSFWPLSDRQIHYGLLNDPPLKHASKPDSTYRNDQKSYKSLVDLLTRARLKESIPFEAIEDPTRPMVTWKVWPETGAYLRREIDEFGKGYWRDLLQSQPNHIEIIGEKNTVGSTIRPIAEKYCIPYTLGRGYCSLRPRYDMAQRYHRSGKDKLILLFLSDFDPEGEDIAHSFARSMRDDFGIENIHPIKVALTSEQVERFDLPPIMSAKTSSSRYEGFVEQHGETVHELEAVAPETLQTLLRDAIDSVIDIEAFNSEIDAEREDSAFLQGVRRTVHAALADLEIDN